MRKLDVAFDVNISQRHKLRLGPFMRDGAHIMSQVKTGHLDQIISGFIEDVIQ